ncbi:MAG: 50S ribosomal protein L9 [Clostridiales bacterium]|jgi:large subunit ribosomal protein L9|nr:50S ribosomal protein L9 [Bacillota bacterium]NLK04712.1 50S ribosomal protein L9 [Clostridiales bacterium]
MEVILLKDVKSLGKKGDVVKVSDGYARNFILPKKLGVEATKQSLHELKLQKDAEDRRNKEILDQARELGKKLEASTVKLQIKAGEGGRTFGSISTKEIATSLKEQAGIDIDRKKIQLSDPIKNVGSYTVGVKLHPEITANIKVVVEAV